MLMAIVDNFNATTMTFVSRAATVPVYDGIILNRSLKVHNFQSALISGHTSLASLKKKIVLEFVAVFWLMA